ncbi:unnamed protein product, partial [Closterium sp. NIES-54]
SAMDAEMASWKSTGTYVDEVPPPGANIVSGMWIFRVKRPPGSPPVFKARYVARGFSQRQGVDYFQTFSPTPKMTTLRVLLHVAAQRDYELHSLDFSTTFLQGSLHEEIWLRRPPGFTGSFPPGTQWSLRRPVYGLRQAPREWHDTLRTTLAALGFAPSTADPSLFLRTDTSLPQFYILVYVDDLVFATADTAGLAHVKSELQKRHTCTDLGELRSYLGLQITRDRAQRTITLTQSHMVQQVLQRFDFTYSSPQATPLSTRRSLSALPSDESVEPSGLYPELVGCLMYLMTCTRPDLAYPLSILARYVAPGRHRPEHMAAAKTVLRYLCSTSGMGLVLGGRRPVVLTGHADASWADDQATQRLSQGYSFSLGSGSVSWRSTRSSSVLSSSCETEIYAGAMAAQELRWLTYLLTDLGEPPRSPPVLYVDNKAMLALCREHRLEHRTKHISLRYFLARELQQRGQLRLAYVASEANTADIFTKALPPGDHQRFCTMLGHLRYVASWLAEYDRSMLSQGLSHVNVRSRSRERGAGSQAVAVAETGLPVDIGEVEGDCGCGLKNSRRRTVPAAPAPPAPAAPAPPAPAAPVAPPAPLAPAAPPAPAAPAPLVPPVPPAPAPPAPAVPPAPLVPAAPVAPPAPPAPVAPAAPPAPAAPAPLARAPLGPTAPASLVPPVSPAPVPPAPAVPPASPVPAAPVAPPAPPAPVAPHAPVAPAPLVRAPPGPSAPAPPVLPPPETATPPVPPARTALAPPGPAARGAVKIQAPAPERPRRTTHSRSCCGEGVSTRLGCCYCPTPGPAVGAPTASPPLGLRAPPESAPLESAPPKPSPPVSAPPGPAPPASSPPLSPPPAAPPFSRSRQLLGAGTSETG